MTVMMVPAHTINVMAMVLTATVSRCTMGVKHILIINDTEPIGAMTDCGAKDNAKKSDNPPLIWKTRPRIHIGSNMYFVVIPERCILVWAYFWIWSPKLVIMRANKVSETPMSQLVVGGIVPGERKGDGARMEDLD